MVPDCGHTNFRYILPMERLKLILSKSRIAYIVGNLNGEIQYISPNFFEVLTWDIAVPPIHIYDLKTHVHPAYTDALESVVEIGKLGLEESEAHIKFVGLDRRDMYAKIACTLIKEDGKSQILVWFQDVTEEKMKESLLKISEAQFKGAFENSAIGMAIISLDGKWLRINKRIADFLGYTASELLEKTFQDITHPDDLEADLLQVQATLAGLLDHYHMEKRYFHKSGKIVHGLLSVSLVRDKYGTPNHFISQIQDLSAIVDSEKALSVSNNQIKSVFNTSNDVSIISCDRNGIINLVSTGTERLLGFTSQELVGTAPIHLFHNKDEVASRKREFEIKIGRSLTTIEYFFELADHQDYFTKQWEYIKKNGESVIVKLSLAKIFNEKGDVTGITAIATDISDIKSIKNELTLSEQRWQFALEGSGNGVWDWNIGSGRVFYSRKWKELLGIQNDIVTDSSDEWVDRIHPVERNVFIDVMQSLILGKSLKFNHEHRIQIKSGDYRWFAVKGMIVERLHNGTPSRIIGTITDIQVQKDTLEQLHHMLEISSDQNKRLLNFAHIISHNLRSHSGNFELLLSLMDSAESEDDRIDIIERIRLVSKRLAETITNLNEIVSVQTNTNIWKSAINLKDIINRVLRGLNGQLSAARAKVILNFDENIVVKANEGYLESIFLNLFTNCVKYRSSDRVLEITVLALETPEGITISVSDNGSGLDLEKYGHKVFGLYNTFHGNSDAKGLGLFLTKNHVESQGGEIVMESEVGRGTTVKFKLP